MPLPDVPPWSEIEQLNFEKETLGLYWSGHPIDRYADDLRDYGAKTTRDLNVKRETVERRRRGSRRGGRQPPPDAGAAAAPLPVRASVPRTSRSAASSPACVRSRPARAIACASSCWTMPDGSIEVVVFPEAFKQYGHLAENGTHGLRDRAVRARRRIGADPGLGDRADRDGAGAAGQVGGDQRVDAAARSRDVREAAGRPRPAQRGPPRGVGAFTSRSGTFA